MGEVFGREDVLASARSIVEGSGAGLAVVLEGAPGIGKTVVLDAVVDAARAAGLLVLETRPAEAEARISLLGLHDLFGPVSEVVLAGLPAPQRASLAAALGLAESVDAMAGEEVRLSIAVTAGLRALADTQRVLVAIDDVQWLDASTASLLETALRRLRSADIRVVATRRAPAGGGAKRGLSLADVYGDALVRLALEPLSVGALHRVIGARLGLSLSRPTLIRLHAASGGNPLFAIEIARSLGHDTPTLERLDASVPADLQTLLWRRVSRLPPRARRVLLAVALTNRPTVQILAAILDEAPTDVESAIGTGIDAGLLVVDLGGVRLAHPLIGAVTRVRAPASARRDLHRRLAAIVDDPTEAALHTALAAAGPDEGVAAALESAARTAFRHGATSEAADLLHRAVRHTPPGIDEALARRRVALAEAHLVSGDTERAARELGSVDIARIEDPTTRLDAVLLFGVVQWFTGDPAEAIALHEDALRDATDPAHRARLHLRLAWLNEHDLRRGWEHASAALELLDPATQAPDYAFALMTRAANELALGLRADHAAIVRGAELQRTHEGWDVSEVPINWALWMDDWDGARSEIDRMVAVAEQRADETTIGHLLAYRAEVEAWSGNLALALQHADAAVQRAESTNQATNLSSALARRALILAAAGDLEDAEADSRSALAMAERLASPTVIALALAGLGSVHRQRDAFADVDRELTRASAGLSATGDVDESAHRFHGDHIDALVALGDLARARELADRLEGRGRLGPRPLASAVAERGRASIALAEGRTDDALTHVESAMEHLSKVMAPLDAARTLLVGAQANRRSGRRKAAEAQLREALRTFETIGARGWAARASAELERLGLRPGDAAELTPSEERIARLAAGGLRNREIAARLFISAKTVEASLARAYAKLGVRSRTELAPALAARPPTGGTPDTFA